MIDPRNVPPVDSDEMLARFILWSKHIRSVDDTIKPDAFVPHPYDDLSVTRHRDATEHELWDAGRAVAVSQNRRLHGRGDVVASVFLEKGLDIRAEPVLNHARLPDNPNHANVKGWPAGDKGRQRLLALEIAAQATLVRLPVPQ